MDAFKLTTKQKELLKKHSWKEIPNGCVWLELRPEDFPDGDDWHEICATLQIEESSEAIHLLVIGKSQDSAKQDDGDDCRQGMG